MSTNCHGVQTFKHIVDKITKPCHLSPEQRSNNLITQNVCHLPLSIPSPFAYNYRFLFLPLYNIFLEKVLSD